MCISESRHRVHHIYHGNDAVLRIDADHFILSVSWNRIQPYYNVLYILACSVRYVYTPVINIVTTKHQNHIAEWKTEIAQQTDTWVHKHIKNDGMILQRIIDIEEWQKKNRRSGNIDESKVKI